MKFLLNTLLILFFFNTVSAENHLKFFIDSALKNNLKLNDIKELDSAKKNDITFFPITLRFYIIFFDSF